MKNPSDYLNPAVRDLPPSGIRKFFDLASEMDDVISLGVGEPDFTTPWHIREAGIRSLEEGRTAYTANQGLPALRQAVSEYLNNRFQMSYDPNRQIIMTVGGSEAIDIAMRALVQPGDEVILLSPGYVAYEPAVRLAGGIPVIIELKEDNQFRLTREMLEEALSDKTKLLLINYPSNPTGGVMTAADYAALVDIIYESGILVVSDEIYAELCYDTVFASPGQFAKIKDQCVIINGFSKAFAMTGWRLGYVAGHEELIAAMNKIHQYVIMSAPTTAQYAAIEALKYGQQDVISMKESYQARRNYLVNGLNRIGLKTFMPQGAFYVFPDISSTGLDSEAFCARLLQKERVACVPGNAFGQAGEGYVRISYAYSMAHLQEALKRIARFLKEL